MSLWGPTTPLRVLSFADKGVPEEDIGAPLIGLVETGPSDGSHTPVARPLQFPQLLASPSFLRSPSPFLIPRFFPGYQVPARISTANYSLTYLKLLSPNRISPLSS